MATTHDSPPPYQATSYQAPSPNYQGSNPSYPVVQTSQQTGQGMVITSQPQVARPIPREWNSGVADCCQDSGICLYGTFCGWCLACSVAGDMGESQCVPCCVPGWLTALRLKIRTQENIPGTLMEDCCTVCWCGPCALCQLAREVRHIKLMEAQAAHQQQFQVTTTVVQHQAQMPYQAQVPYQGQVPYQAEVQYQAQAQYQPQQVVQNPPK